MTGTHMYRGAILGRRVCWIATATTYQNEPVCVYADSPARLVRLLRGDPQCQCIRRVLGVSEIHDQEGRYGAA